jgi:peptidylprolyl isomerase
VFRISHILLAVILMAAVIVTGCSLIPGGVKNGDTVQVNYTGKLADGTIFDSSVGRAPLEFTLGKGDMIPGFEKAVLGMRVGQKKTVTIPAAEAFGPYRNDLVVEVPTEKLPSNLIPEVGKQVVMSEPDGSTIMVTITKVTDNTSVTMDANSPLAGKDLTFDIELVTIK